LPLNPVDTIYGNSPYSSASAFAFNTLFISLDLLVEEGLVSRKDCAGAVCNVKKKAASPSSANSSVAYPSVFKNKNAILECAYASFAKKQEDDLYEEFCSQNAFWLDDYALFMALKQHFKGTQWNAWPEGARDRNPTALKDYADKFKETIAKIKFLQYVAFKQWNALRRYCSQKRIKLIGDIPIYVNFDSADVWAHPEIFKLNEKRQPIVVAGVPPDYFSKTGQRWGNPVYDWDSLKKYNYDWWIKRITYNLMLFDAVRVDHFRGFVACWEIPYSEKTAINGKWIEAPAQDFFNALSAAFPDLPIIAEDLGIITPDVVEIMRKFNFPGMKVLLFAFGGDIKKHPYIPENYTDDCVVYTGTHDNNTIKGWWHNDATKQEKQNIESYLNKEINENVLPWDMIGLAVRSKAAISIIPMQDVLELGQESRMNKPGTTHGNWQWRILEQHLSPDIASRLSSLLQLSNRVL
jgi:4-alpha-glucanotransferase